MMMIIIIMIISIRRRRIIIYNWVALPLLKTFCRRNSSPKAFLDLLLRDYGRQPGRFIYSRVSYLRFNCARFTSDQRATLIATNLLSSLCEKLCINRRALLVKLPERNSRYLDRRNDHMCWDIQLWYDPLAKNQKIKKKIKKSYNICILSPKNIFSSLLITSNREGPLLNMKEKKKL